MIVISLVVLIGVALLLQRTRIGKGVSTGLDHRPDRSEWGGVSIVMVGQNARRCLQVCERGYVLDQGRNAYPDTGSALTNDPKVIELYLGTLTRPPSAHPAG